eukprot:s22_g27.t1
MQGPRKGMTGTGHAGDTCKALPSGWWLGLLFLAERTSKVAALARATRWQQAIFLALVETPVELQDLRLRNAALAALGRGLHWAEALALLAPQPAASSDLVHLVTWARYGRVNVDPVIRVRYQGWAILRHSSVNRFLACVE